MLKRNFLSTVITKHLPTVILFGAFFFNLVIPVYAGGDHQAWLEEQSFIWGTQNPARALVRWDRASSDPVGFMVDTTEMDALQQQFNIERSYTTPPPPLQGFAKFVISDDYMTILICEYDFWTGEREGCEEFF